MRRGTPARFRKMKGPFSEKKGPHKGGAYSAVLVMFGPERPWCVANRLPGPPR